MAVEGHASQRPKSDPNVKIPDAVKRAAARSDQLITDNNGSPKPVVPPTTITSFDPKNPNPPGEGVTPQSNASPPNPQPVTPPANEEPDYKHMYESTKGRMEREADERRRLAQQLADTQRTLAAMSIPVQSSPQPGGGDARFGAPGAQARKVTQKELDEFGPELLDIIGRRAQEVYDPIIGQLQAEVAQLKGATASTRNVQQLDAQTRLFETMNKEIPNWEQMNVDPNFLQWLDFPDDLSGMPRKELLTAAFKQGRSAQVIAAFRGFQAYQAASDPAAAARQQQGNEATLRSNPTPGVDLASLAAPGRAKSGQAPVTPEKPDVTRAEIAQFYAAVTRGEFKGREAEYNLIQEQISSASREGRIR